MAAGENVSLDRGGSSCRGTGFMETNLWQGLRALDRLVSPWTAVLEVRLSLTTKSFDQPRQI